MQEAWATKTGRVSIRREVAWMDGWMDRDLTSGLEMLRRFSQGCRCRFCFSRWSLCGFWYDSLEFTWQSRLFDVSIGEWSVFYRWSSYLWIGTILLGLLSCAWLCDASVGTIELSFPEGQLTTPETTMTEDSYVKLKPLWHQIGMRSWPYDDTTMLIFARSLIRVQIGFLWDGTVMREREFLQLVSLVSRWSFAKARRIRYDATRLAAKYRRRLSGRYSRPTDCDHLAMLM